jgi:hypothetical protein
VVSASISRSLPVTVREAFDTNIDVRGLLDVVNHAALVVVKLIVLDNEVVVNVKVVVEVKVEIVKLVVDVVVVDEAVVDTVVAVVVNKVAEDVVGCWWQAEAVVLVARDKHANDTSVNKADAANTKKLVEEKNPKSLLVKTLLETCATRAWAIVLVSSEGRMPDSTRKVRSMTK